MLQKRRRIRAAVGARIRDVPPLIQVLAGQHGVGRRKVELVAGLLLQRGRGERQRRGLDKRAHIGRMNHVLKRGGRVQECGASFRGVVPLAEVVLQIQLGEVADRFKHRAPVGGVNGALVVVNEAQGGRLTAAGRERGASASRHVGPQRGRDFETDQHVQRLAGDLRVHGVHVERLRGLDGALQRGLGDFVEHDALGGGQRQAEQAARVVRNAGALAVVVRHEVCFLARRNERPYFRNLRRFGLHRVKLRHVGERGVNVLQPGQLSYVPERGRAHVLVRAQMAHNGAAFGRGFHEEQDFIVVAVAVVDVVVAVVAVVSGHFGFTLYT